MIDVSDITDLPTENQLRMRLNDDERSRLEEDLKKTQEDIEDLRITLSLKLQHESALKHKLGLTLLSEIQSDIKSGINTLKDSATYHKTIEVLSAAKEKTSSTVSETKQIVSKKLHDVAQSDAYKEVGNKVGSLMTSMKDAFFFAAYGPPPISDEEYEEAVSVEQFKDNEVAQVKDQKL